MEDVLEVYQRPHDPHCPVVCLDETTKQLIKETRRPIPARPGQLVRHDYEYERNGTANLFMLFAPLEGWRHVEVTDRHRASVRPFPTCCRGSITGKVVDDASVQSIEGHRIVTEDH
jgi:hypothetical protein